MVSIETVLLQGLGIVGAAYRFGAEADFADPHPSPVDCSEYIEWSCNSLSPPVVPTMPDGSWLQWRHCAAHGTLVAITTAQRTRGALLFRFSRDPAHGSRPAGAHVALSLGDGSTLEARGAAYGVGSWTSSSARGWTHAALIPGVEYSAPHPSYRLLRLAIPRMRGVDVVDLQQRLILAGYGGGIRVPVDGVFGPITERALVAFQHDNGLDADGVLGPLSRALLP